MRGTVEGLESPHPLGLELPSPYAEDDFAQRFVAGLDEVLAVVFVTLDNLDAYFDADLAPADFLAWLATWVGVDLDENWTMERRRALVRRAVTLYGMRGTVAGLQELLELSTGAQVEISDSGGVAWSPVPGGELPGTPDATVTVRVQGADVDAKRIATLVRDAVPAHIACEVVMG